MLLKSLLIILILAVTHVPVTPAQTSDSFDHLAKLKASDPGSNEHFGNAVSMSDSILLIGAYQDLLDGSPNGAAYVFRPTDDGTRNWQEVAKLTPKVPLAFDDFGYSVSLSGTIAAVGAPKSDDPGLESGSVYLFAPSDEISDDWTQIAELEPNDLAAGDHFGISVAIDGHRVLVGSYRDDDNGNDSGSAYIFERDHGGIGNWGQVTKLLPFDGELIDQFGTAVALHGSLAVVATVSDDDACSELQDCNSGAAHIFERDFGGSENWGQVAKLTADDAAEDAYFGQSVAIDGDTILIGAPASNSEHPDSGAAYVFRRGADPQDWQQIAKLVPDDATAHDQIGFSVALKGSIAIVGAVWNDDACPADPLCNSGSAYVFERDSGGADNWGQIGKATAPDAETDHQFGYGVALSQRSFVATSPKDDLMDSVYQAGSAHVFSLTLFCDGFESGDTSAWN